MKNVSGITPPILDGEFYTFTYHFDDGTKGEGGYWDTLNEAWDKYNQVAFLFYGG